MPGWILPSLALLAVVAAGPYDLLAQERPPQSVPLTDVRLTVHAGPEQLAARRLDVEMQVTAAATGDALLSMAAWTPGAYRLAHYASAVSAMEVLVDGRPARWDKRDPDTWRIPLRRGQRATLRYRAAADRLDVDGSWTDADFAFFNGSSVLLYVEGRPETPARLHLRTDARWRVVTAMATDGAPDRFRAADQHDLLDHPVFVGRFDLDSALVGDAWMRLATWPVGGVAAARRADVWEALTRSVEPLVRVFGDRPWDRYTVLQVLHPDVQGMRALEHAASELALLGTPFLDAPFVRRIHAHEIVHAWNVKRLRPADLWPYRYDAAQPTPWLWFSEGVTDYYADLALLRGGLDDEAGFLEATLAKIDGVALRPAVSAEDASLQAWLGMRDGSDDLYYDKGSLLGLALDILIRDASDNRRSLDHVMRELYTVAWKAGRGFTHDDLWNAVARATGGRAWGDFERRYIDGREAFPWADWLARGGWRIAEDTASEPRLGALLAGDAEGVRISELDAAGMAAQAGLRTGDVLVEIGGMSTRDPRFGRRWRDEWGRRPGAAVTVVYLRDGVRRSTVARIAVERRLDRRLEPDPRASAKALRIRTGILQGLPRP